jgi:hypothetical protein
MLGREKPKNYKKTCPPQIAQDVTQVRTQAAAVGSRRLTA